MAQKVIVFGVDGLIPEFIYKFSEEGYLPHISQMLNQGASTELLPFISTWGDVNFVSLLSGQSPGTCWEGQGKPKSGKRNLLSCLDDQGIRCALVHFPGSVSTEGTNHYVFASFKGESGVPSFELAAPTVYSTHLDKWTKQEKTEFLGWPPQQALAYHEKGNQRPIHMLGDGYGFHILFHDQTQLKAKIEAVSEKRVKISWLGESGENCPIGATHSDGGTQPGSETCLSLETGCWSSWTPVTFQGKSGVVRFKLLAFDGEAHTLDLLQSQINISEGLSDDPDVESFINENCGPFISKWTVKAHPDEPYYETSFEEGEYQALWLAEVALRLLNERNFDLFATVFRLNDETHHNCLGEYDPASPHYSPERSVICEEVIRKSYQVLDRTIRKIMNEKKDDTLLLLVSDHGNVPNSYLCDIYGRLEQCSLCTLDENGGVVWDQTKAYLKAERGGMEIFINMKGRENHGIVEPEDYEKVQTEIFKVLTTWYHEAKNVIGIALKKQDAAMIGYWGAAVGDVVFAYNQGFVWGTNTNGDVVARVSSPGANHGPQIPSAATKHSSNYGIALLYGTTVKAGYHRNRQHCRPYHMNDVGTTIAKVLDAANTGDLDGCIMNDLLI